VIGASISTVEQVRLSRKELYELVWKVPGRQLAARYGISDVALAKTCRRLGVPRPSRGHWARVAAGKKVVRATLPATRTGQDEFVVLMKVDDASTVAPQRPRLAVSVPDTLIGAHRAVLALARALKRAELDEYDRLVIRGLGAPVLATTVTVHRRALLIIEALCRTLTERGHEIRFEWLADQNTRSVLTSESTSTRAARLVALIEDEFIELSLEERVVVRPYEASEEEQRRMHSGEFDALPKTMRVVEGLLELRVHERGVATTRWRDWKRRRLDSSVGEITLALEEEARRRRVRREEATREQSMREARERQIAEARARELHEKQMRADLLEMATAWSRSQDVRRFLDAVRVASSSARSVELESWLEWATGHIDAVDPVAKLLQRYAQSGTRAGVELGASTPNESE